MTETPQGVGVRALRGLVAVNVLTVASAVVFGLAARLASDGQVHVGRVWVWPLLVVLVPVAIQTDRLLLRRQGRRLTLGVAVADALLVVSAAAVGLLVILGWWFTVASAALLPVAYLTWLGRSRALAGHWDGPLVVAALFGLISYASVARPWEPSSVEWSIVAAIAAGAAVLGAVSSVQLVRATGSPGATDA